MSTRQNKKRKARNSMNRERTVTTLAEDPNTAFLVPTPSEDPPNLKSAVSMSAPFAGQGSNSGFQMSHSYPGFPNNYMSAMPPPVGTPYQFYQQQQQQPQNVTLPPGKNDLEILEKLKEMIKNNQHEVFKPVPNPHALAAIYLGPRNLPSTQSQVPPHPEQIPDPVGAPVMSHANGATGNGLTRPRSESWDRKSSVHSAVSSSQPMPNTMSKEKIETTRVVNQMQSDGKPEIPVTRQDSSHVIHSSRSDQTLSSHSVPERSVPDDGVSSTRLDPPPVKVPGNNGKDDPRSELKSQWADPHSRDDVRVRPDADRPPPPPSRPPPDRSGASDSRGPPPRDQRFYDRDRERDRDSFRDREREREFDRDRRADSYRSARDDRRPDDRPRVPEPAGNNGNGNGNARRPPPEDRHYEPRRSDPLPPRRYDSKAAAVADELMAVDRRPEPPNLPDDRTGRPPIPEDRSMRPPPPPADDRAVPPTRAPLSSQTVEARAAVIGLADSRSGRSVDDRRGPPPSDERSSGRPLDSVRPDDRGSRVPPPVVDSRAPPLRPPPAVEERGNRPPPPSSLQDRIGGHPASSRGLDDRPVRPLPPPEKRPSGASDDRPVRTLPDDRPLRSAPPVADREHLPPRSAPRPLDDADRGRPPLDNDRAPPSVEDRRGRPGPPPGGDRYRPSPPSTGDRGRPPPPSRGGPTPDVLRRRSVSVARSDVRPKIEPRSPSPRRLQPPPSREYRPLPRDASRERPEIRPPPRGEPDRPYDDRRSDIMNVDSGPNGRVAYRRNSPPPIDRPPPQRASWTRDPPSITPDDPDRRFPPEPRRGEYYDEGRDWTYRDARDPRDSDHDIKPRGWDRGSSTAPPPPPAREYERERGFYTREPSPPLRPAWTARDERERRPYSPPPSTSSRVEPMRPPLSSRLADPYPDERSGFPPRDFDRPPYRDPSPPPFSRIRPRSPSPLRRAPGPVDDLRAPPLKRARDEPYSASSGYYSPPRRDPLLSAPEYPPRTASPPPASTGSYYDRPVYSSGGPPRDRDYPRDRPLSDDRYGSYDRRALPLSPPSPPPFAGRAYPVDPRDERRYSLGRPGRP